MSYTNILIAESAATATIYALSWKMEGGFTTGDLHDGYKLTATTKFNGSALPGANAVNKYGMNCVQYLTSGGAATTDASEGYPASCQLYEFSSTTNTFAMSTAGNNYNRPVQQVFLTHAQFSTTAVISIAPPSTVWGLTSAYGIGYTPSNTSGTITLTSSANLEWTVYYYQPYESTWFTDYENSLRRYSKGDMVKAWSYPPVAASTTWGSGTVSATGNVALKGAARLAASGLAALALTLY